MAKSLLEQLPEIVAKGRQMAEKILENLEGRHRIGLQTREWVLPSKDSVTTDWITANERLGHLEPLSQRERGRGEGENWHNRLIYGDNLLAMAALLAGDDNTPSLRGKVDLIYIDPPFDSKADYRTKITLPGVELEQKPTVIEQFAYSDTWADGTASYLAMITPRLILMRELLSDTGSIYVHLDWHVGHYVKLILDEVFGKERFQNEIIWQRTSAHNDPERYGIIHDTLFLYTKNAKYFWATQYTKYTEEYINERFRSVEENTGRRYWLNTLTAPSHGRPSKPAVFFGNERTPPPGTMWRFKQDKINELIDQGRIVATKSGMPYIKQYLDESQGRSIQSIWDDTLPSKSGSERLNYATQKPGKLLVRIIQASCPENGLVADFFGGSGTTAAVAEKLNRRWITTDLGKPACMIMRKRLIDQNAQPFLYQAIGDYQVEAAKASLGRQFKIGDLSQIVLQLFGALPLPLEENPMRNLGYLPSPSGRGVGGEGDISAAMPSPQPSPTGRGSKTLVFADSPNKLTGTATLKKAIAQRDTLMGGWDKVVVLGWNFEPSIGETITALNDDKLEVLVIPPDLLDRLKKKGGLDKLKGTVRFASLQYLTIKPIVRIRHFGRDCRNPDHMDVVHPNISIPGAWMPPIPGDMTAIEVSIEEETFTIELDNYVLLSPEAINLDEANRAKLQGIINSEPLALIEYWAVDPDYDGQLFRSVWQDYRGNTENDGDPLRVITQAQLTVPAKSGSRKICVRVVDVFGFEAEVVVEVAE